MHDAKVTVTSLQLVGPWLSEAQLLNAGRLVEAAVKKGGEPLETIKSAGQAVPNLR
jgi:hypothetical protein